MNLYIYIYNAVATVTGICYMHGKCQLLLLTIPFSCYLLFFSVSVQKACVAHSKVLEVTGFSVFCGSCSVFLSLSPLYLQHFPKPRNVSTCFVLFRFPFNFTLSCCSVSTETRYCLVLATHLDVVFLVKGQLDLHFRSVILRLKEI